LTEFDPAPVAQLDFIGLGENKLAVGGEVLAHLLLDVVGERKAHRDPRVEPVRVKAQVEYIEVDRSLKMKWNAIGPATQGRAIIDSRYRQSNT
jgi:hypothetical protein